MRVLLILVALHWFHSPSGNIQCEVAPNAYAYCQTFKPPQTAKLSTNGRTAVCTHRACPVGNGPENATTLGYGTAIRLGAFRCSSMVSGMRCVVVRSGHGFTIAQAGIRTF